MKNLVFRFTVLVFLLSSLSYSIQAQENYQWSQVRVGGGGYITGMKIHPNNTNVAYFRTDVGGAYKWHNTKKEMVQLLNYAADKSNYYGVAGIALHPTLENIIYLAVDRGNTTATSKILYSEDYGSTWDEIDVTGGIKFGANGGREGGTGFDDKDREGAPITLNPANPDELWVGTREKGLWVLDLTKTDKWRKIGGVPDNTKEASIRSVVFHPENPNTIFVGYAQFGIYRSTDGGSSFTNINNGFNDLEHVADLSFSKNGNKIYAAVRNKGIYKLDNPSNTTNWEKLNLPFANLGKGYQTVTASPHDDELVVASPAATSGKNLKNLQVSEDGGTTWVTKSNVSITNTFEWASTDNAGFYTSQLEFDPEDPNKLYTTGWFGLWHTDNWDANQVQWANDRAKGHEEIVTTGLRAFPANSSSNTLLLNSADSPGVLVKDTDSYENSDLKDKIDDSSLIVKGQDIAICEAYPNNFAITATNLWSPTNNNPSYGSLFYTNNGGESYTRSQGYDRNWGKSLVGTSVQDPANIVVVHGDKIHYSKDRGATFTAATHPTLSNVVENNVFIAHDPFAKDMVLNQVFYLYDRSNGHVIKSLNSGKDWFKTDDNLPTDNNNFTKASLQAAPGKAGHLWFNSPKKGLYYSENQGDAWIKLSNVVTADVMALGKAKTADGYPTIYFIGKLTGDTSSALYRSTDKGQNWTKVIDASSQFILSSPRYMAGDRVEFGKVYVGVSGMGVWQGSIVEEVPTNTIPVANAGVDQTIDAGEEIRLDGSASSDADGDELTYLWTAPDGITLINSDWRKPTFIGPEFDTTTTITFSLVVNDGQANSVADEVVITVKAKEEETEEEATEEETTDEETTEEETTEEETSEEETTEEETTEEETTEEETTEEESTEEETTEEETTEEETTEEETTEEETTEEETSEEETTEEETTEEETSEEETTEEETTEEETSEEETTEEETTEVETTEEETSEEEETEEETEEESEEEIVDTEGSQEETIEVLELVLYPNPTADFISINYGDTEVTEWTIFDLYGKKLKRGTEQQIDVRSLITGVYILVLDTPKGLLKKRIVRRD